MRKRKLEGRRGVLFRIGPAILKPALFATTRHEWIDAEKIPATGGCVLVTNHLTKVDPITVAHPLYDYGRMPRYLAKDGLFEVPVLGTLMREGGQIPVKRMSAGATQAFAAAVDAVNNGELIVVYPEGTVTRDPGLWPMRGKTGAARIALETGAPVVPLGHWGEHEILAPYASKPDLFPRKLVRVKVGDPVRLDDLRDKGVTAETIKEATDRIMAAITDLVADLRGEEAPAERFDPKAAGVDEIGNPNKRKGKA